MDQQFQTLLKAELTILLIDMAGGIILGRSRVGATAPETFPAGPSALTSSGCNKK